MIQEDLAQLQSRLLKVERRSRLFLVGSVLSVLILAILGVAVQRGASQPAILSVREVQIRDAQHKAYIRLSLDPDSDNAAIQIGSVFGNITLRSGPLVEMIVKEEGTTRRLYLSSDGLSVKDTGSGFVRLWLNQGRPSLSLTDVEGFQATLGDESLRNRVTGSLENRSAASLVLFDKDKKVIWSAP